RAILDHAAECRIEISPADRVVSLSGRGAEGWVDGARILLGNHRLFEERQLCSPVIHGRLAELSARACTLVLVARDHGAVGIIAVADRPREAARDAVALLRRRGIESIVMLTGDSRTTAEAIGAAIGVDEVRAELLP